MGVNDLNLADREVWIGSQKVGYTKGGVDVTIERNSEDITADEFGAAPLNIAHTGTNFMVKFRAVEIAPYTLSKALPEGDYDASSADDKLGIGRKAGYLLGQHAQELRLHPRNRAQSDTTQDIFMWKAVSVENLEMPFKIDEQTVLEVTMRALVDENRSDGSLLGRIGPDLIS